MKSVFATYWFYVEQSGGMQQFEKDNITYDDALAIIDSFPFAHDEEQFGESEESGGLLFCSGDMSSVGTSFQIAIMGDSKYTLFLETQLAPTKFLIFGGKKAVCKMKNISLDQVRSELKEYFEHDTTELFNIYKTKRS